jgi:hypothetical protein
MKIEMAVQFCVKLTNIKLNVCPFNDSRVLSYIQTNGRRGTPSKLYRRPIGLRTNLNINLVATPATSKAG